MSRLTVLLIVAAALVLSVVSCRGQEDRIEPAAIDHRTPLGVEWNLTHEQTDEYTKEQRERCEERLRGLLTALPDKNTDRLVEDCVFNQPQEAFLDQAILPTGLDGGELSVVFANRDRASVIEYSYLHRVLPNFDDETQKLRDARFRKINRALVKRYGQPNAYGTYDQSSETGFVLTEEAQKTCHAWIVDGIGIILCSQRVILIDGIEMSLSYINLATVPIGPTLNELILAGGDSSADDQFPAIDVRTNDSLIEGAGLLDALEHFLSDDDFKYCRGDDLDPVTHVWTLSDEEELAFRPVLEELTADALAEYAIEYAGNLDINIEARQRERHTLFLLKRAADQGSSIAQNEIGASLLYCYNHVSQDLEKARFWFEAAIQGGDTLAMNSLARMHMLGMTDAPDAEQEVRRLLAECGTTNPQLCADTRQALATLAD